jgi:hypothetical protein
MRSAEALGFTVAVIIYIWFLRARWHWGLFVLAALVLASLVWHSETLDSLGLSAGAFLDAISAWWLWLAFGFAAMVVLGCVRPTTPPLVNH